jgi:glutathione S-transferase
MQNTKLTLYFSKNSCAIASMAALEQAELRFDAVPVEMSPDGAGDDAFRRLNPRRQVPVLAVGERIFRETGAIFRYLDGLCPQAGLLPVDPDEQIRASEWIGYLGGTVHPAFRLLFRPQRFVGLGADAQLALRTETRSLVQKLLDDLDAELTGDWVLRQPSAIDLYLFVFTRWASLIKAPLSNRLAAHRARVVEFPAMARALALEEEACAAPSITSTPSS